MIRYIALIASFFLAQPAWAKWPVGQPLPHVILKGETGGLVAGGVFDSDTLRGNVQLIFYVDPDERDLNTKATDTLKATDRLKEKYKTTAIINMAATAIPNFILSSMIKDSQAEFPMTRYVEDLAKVLVKQWHFTDDSNDILVLDRSGNVVFSEDGKLDDAGIARLISTIESAINAP